ncbi:MAG: S-layer homology domain-containing protein [Ruminococcaceae bacterium]|nr:S-layer homology domain-containing protein [Oscillospiraceae bacterium]
MNPGDTFTATGDEDFVVTAEWSENAEASTNSKSFLYTGIHSGIVDVTQGAIVSEAVEEDGFYVIKATPVPEYRENEKPKEMRFEHLSLANKIKVDVDEYKYATVTYKYVSPKPLTDVVKIPHITLTRNSGMFTTSGMAFKPVENMELKVNEWTTVLYEFPNFEGKFTNPDADHILQQFHLQPYGNGVTNDKVTKDDVVYIQSMTFHKEKPVKARVELPYITGFEDGSFGLGQTMTRAQACTVVARLVAGGDANVPAGTSAFTDVTANDWFAKYVAYCEAKGLLKSYSGTFAPNQAITRAEFVELVYNMGLLSDAGKNGTFTDVPADHARAEVISAAGKAGLVNGYDNGDGTFSFKPDNTISREEVVTVINNAYGRKSDKKYLESFGYGFYFTDVKSDHWAFPAIIDASVMHFACREVGAETDTWLYKLELQDVNDEESNAAALAKVQEVDALTDKRIAEIRNTKTTVEVKGTKYYFAADGDDANDGLSPEKPKKTLAAVNMLPLKAGDGVYFKRGDTFRGQIIAKSGVTYTAFGEGAKPNIYASPANFAGADNWEQTEVANVWKLKTPITHDVGLVVFNEGEAWTEKRIMGRPEFKDGGLANLDVDLAMWHDVPAPTDATGYVYVRSDKGNPGALYNSIELNPRAHIIRVSVNDVTIDNLCIKYTGAHGVSSGGVKNLVVTNCEFGFIGGSWFRTDTLSRYGNAVEIYGAVDGYVVDNCYIYHCYDAGVTHQLTQSPEKECIMADIHYTNNVITYTSYPVEYFINEPNAGITHAYLGLEISDNIIRYTGYGFGDQRPDKTAAAGIKSWNTYNAADNFVMNNNIFDRSKYKLIQLGAFAAAWMPAMDGNTYIIEEGGEFGNIGNTDGGTAVTAIALQKYVEANSKDKNAKVFVLKKAQ